MAARACIATLQAKNAQLKAEIENLKSEHDDAISRMRRRGGAGGRY